MALGISREQERQDDHSPRQQAPIYRNISMGEFYWPLS